MPKEEGLTGILGEGKKEKSKVPTEKEKAQVPSTGKPEFVPGTEEESIEDMVMPRLRLLQSVSTEVETKESELGKIRHSLSGEEWEKVQVIPLFIRKSRICFDSDNVKGAPKCFAPDSIKNRSGERCLEECPFNEAWKWKDNEPPQCDLVRSFPSLILKDGKLTKGMDFAAMNFVKSSTPAATTLIYLRQKSGDPYWNYVYELSTALKPFTKGSAYIFNIRQVRETTEEEREKARKIYFSIRGKAVREEEVAGGDDNFDKEG